MREFNADGEALMCYAFGRPARFAADYEMVDISVSAQITPVDYFRTLKRTSFARSRTGLKFASVAVFDFGKRSVFFGASLKMLEQERWVASAKDAEVHSDACII